MKKALSFPFLVVGFALLALGVYAFQQGVDGKDLVREQLAASQVTTPADASIPNTVVHDAASAQSMASWISATMDKATGGRTWNDVGHYLTAAGTDTDDITEAAIGADGQPTVNPLRQVAFEASTGTTALGQAAIALKMGDIAIGLGILFGLLGFGLTGTGLAFSGLRVPAMAKRLHLPHPHLHHA